MSLSGTLLLSPDVELVPVADLPETTRASLGGSEGEWALTDPYSRSSSVLIDDGFAQLLGEFRTPTSVAAAVLTYCRRRGLDAENVLEEAYSALRGCWDRGFLVAAGSIGATGHRHHLAVGDRVGTDVVLRCVQALGDTEIYQLARADGGVAALKTIGLGCSAAESAAFEREILVLGELDGHIAPGLLDTGVRDGFRWLSMEWCEGVRVTAAAAALRASVDGPQQLLELGIQVTAAYVHLHDRGLVHGDVHPGNVLVAPDASVRLVDFGLARRADGSHLDHAARGGAPGYLAPDHAQALVTGTAPPAVNPQSELFSLGALLYEIFTGASYLDFSLDNATMLQQATVDPPLPFFRRGCTPWPEVESALAAALETAAYRRLGSIRDLHDRLAAARRGLRATPSRRDPGAGIEAALDVVLAASRPGGTWFEDGLPTQPMCSIAYGSAGLALALHHVSVLRDDPSSIALAGVWAARAAGVVDDPAAFRHVAMEVTDKVTGLVSPFHRASGVYAAQALISHSVNDTGAMQRALAGFARESRHPCDSFDLVLGRTGTLLASAILLEACRTDPDADLEEVRDLGQATADDLWAWLDALPPVASATAAPLLGVAHGWAGYLLASLRWCQTASVPIRTSLHDRLEQLAALSRPEGRAVWWPWSTSGHSMSPGWCNGSAGFVHLWTAAYTAFADQRWLGLAEGAGWHASTGTQAVPQLCCGLAGQAYAHLGLYRHTGETHWLSLARQLATSAAAGVNVPGTSSHVSGSLHKGDVGVAVLASDLEFPDEATMPFFGPAG